MRGAERPRACATLRRAPPSPSRAPATLTAPAARMHPPRPMSISLKMAAVFAIGLATVVSGGCGDDDGTHDTDSGSGGDADSGTGPTTCPRVDFFCNNHMANCMFGDGPAQYADDATCRAAFCSYSDA